MHVLPIGPAFLFLHSPASFTTHLSGSATHGRILNTTASISIQNQTQTALTVGAMQSMVTEMRLMSLYVPGKSVCYTSPIYSWKMLWALNEAKTPCKKR